MANKKMVTTGKPIKKFNNKKKICSNNITVKLNELRKKLEILSDKYDSRDSTISSEAGGHIQQRRDEKSQVKLNENSEVKLNENSEVKLNENSEVKLNENSEVKLNENSEVKLNENSQVKLSEQSEVKLNEKSEVKLNENSEVKLNVGGTVFYSNRGELRRYPNTRLGKLAEASSISEILKFCDDYKPSTDEFYFNKRSTNFSDILEFYRSGKLHINSDRCKTAFIQNLEYWEISCSYIQPCCVNKQLDNKGSHEKNRDFVAAATLSDVQSTHGSMEGISDSIWTMFENPEWSAILVDLVTIFSLMSTFLSIITIFLNTIA